MKKILVIFTIILLLTGCGGGVYKEQGPNDASTFKNTYENADINNKMVYVTLDETKQLIEEGSGILFIGNPNNVLTESLVPSLIEVTNTINTNVYYYEMYNTDNTLKGLLNTINEVNNSSNLEIPLIVFIKNGKIVDYFYGNNNSILTSENYDLFKSQLLEKYKKLQ